LQHADPRKENDVNEKTREEILSLIAHHVTAVNYIYRDTKFDGRSEHRNIKFEVQRIKVNAGWGGGDFLLEKCAVGDLLE
jgi:disintegrin and metalloproteinase domain-containing protein 10